MPVLFSIVITTYNNGHQLSRALDSLAQQTCQDFEVHVVDDGSTDNTSKVAEDHATNLDLIYHYQEHWGGPARGRNTGLKHAKGTWVTFLDGDDWWYPERLAEVSNRIGHGADVIFHELDYYNATGRMGRTTNGRILYPPVFEDLLVNGNCLANSATIVRRQLLQEVGGLSEDKDLISVEDYDLWLRLAKVTEHFLYMPQSLGGYWLGDENISLPSENYIQKIQLLSERNISLLPPEKRREARYRMNYIIACNKQGMGEISAMFKFIAIAAGAKNPGLKLRSMAQAILTPFKSLRRGEGKS